MQGLKFQGNEVAVSMAANAFEEVLEGKNMSLFVSGALGVGKTSLMSRLRTRLASPGMLERFSALAGRPLEEGFIHFADYDGSDMEAHDGYAVVFIDDIQDKDDRQLDALRGFVRTVVSSWPHFMLVMAYTNSGVANRSALMLPVMSEIRGTLANSGAGAVDIEVKPMTLADIATMVMDTLSPNNFESNFVNKLKAFTGGVQLFITETIRYMREVGVLHKDGGGAWTLDNDRLLGSRVSIGTLEAKRVELLSAATDFSEDGAGGRFVQLCDNYSRHHIVGEQAADTLAEIAVKIAGDGSLPANVVSAAKSLLDHRSKPTEPSGHRPASLIIDNGNIAEADGLLDGLSRQYKMPQVLENAQYMLDILDKDDLEGRMTALRYKTDALLFLGMYQDATSSAECMRDTASTDTRFADRLHEACFRLGYAAGQYHDFKTSDTNMYKAAEIAERMGDTRSASYYRAVHASLMVDRANVNEGLRLANESLRMAEANGDIKTIAEAHMASALIYRAMMSTDDSISEADKSLEYAEKSGDIRLIARVHTAAGMCYLMHHSNETAVDHLHKAEATMVKIGDNPGLASVYTGLGHLANDSGNYDTAIKHYQDSLSITKSIALYIKMLPAYIGIGSAYMYKGNTGLAGQHYKEAMATAKKVGSFSALSYAFSSIGEFYQLSDDFEKALSYYRTAYEYDKKSGDIAGIYGDLVNMAEMCVYLDKVDEGIAYIQEAQKYSVGYLAKSMAGSINNTLAGLYVAKKDYETALEYYRKGLEVDIKNNDLVNASISYGNISSVYFSLNDFTNAEKMADKAIEIDRRLDDQLQLAGHIARQAFNYRSHDRLKDSRDLYFESARIFRRLNLLDDTAQMLRNAALCQHELGEHNAAEKTLREALATTNETGNYSSQPAILSLMAHLAAIQSHTDEALSLYKKAIDMYTLHDLKHNATYNDTMRSWAELYIQDGKHREAIECYNRLADTYKDDDPDSYVQCRILAGKVYMTIHDEENARATFDDVFLKIGSMKDNDKKCVAMSDFGDFLCWNKMVEQGIACKAKAAEEMRGSDDREALARLYYTLAERQQEHKRYDDALANYNTALKIYRSLGQKYNEGLVSNNIGYIYDVTCKIRQAAQHYYAAYQCYKQADDFDGMYNNITNAAMMYDKISESIEAIKCNKIAYDLLSFPDADPQEKGNAALNLARSLADNDIDDAVQYFNIAYAKYRDADSLEDILAAMDALAVYYAGHKKRLQTKSCVNVTLSLLDKYKAADPQVKIYNAAAVIHTYLDDMDKAIECFHKGIMILAGRDMWLELAHDYFYMTTKLIRDDDKLTLPVTVNGKPYRLGDYCIECLGFAIRTAEKEGEQDLLADALGTRSLLRWNNKQYDLFEQDMTDAIRLSSTDEGKVSLMLHRGILYMMGKEYEKAHKQFAKAGAEASVRNLYEEKVLSEAWLCYLYCETGDTANASLILRRLEGDLEFAVAKVPGLGSYLVKRKL